MFRCTVVACAFLLGIPLSLPAAAETREDGVELLGVERIWDEGAHNAFTDLIRFQGVWYCTFREGTGHVNGDGLIRVIRSEDGKAWESAALIAEDGIDLRDPKFSVTPDGRLMIVAGGSVYEGSTLVGRQPRVLFSNDGTEWTAPQRVMSEGDWLWRVTWFNEVAYGVSYHDATPEGWTLSLVKSRDGVDYAPVTQLEVPDRGNEVTLRFRDDGACIALVRREAGTQNGWIGLARPPYTEWEWQETSMRLGGPDFIILPDGQLWAGTREYSAPVSTVLARMTLEDLEPVIEVPSGGDTSYPGFVWHDETLWMSYYASHEGQSNIYLARFRIPLND